MMSNYHCTQCGQEIKNGEFMAIIGEMPPTPLSTAAGWVDKLVDNDLGNVYCADCVLSANDTPSPTPHLPASD